MPSVSLALGKRVVVVITRAVFGISSKKRRQSVVLPHPDGPVTTIRSGQLMRKNIAIACGIAACSTGSDERVVRESFAKSTEGFSSFDCLSCETSPFLCGYKSCAFLQKQNPSKCESNQQNAVKSTQSRDGFEPTAVVSKKGMNEVACTVRAYAEIKRQHNPEVEQSRNVWSEDMVAHVADLQETMRGQYRQHGNTANDKEILPVKDATDEGEAEEKRQHKLEIFAFLGIRLPEVQEKPQMRNGKNQQSKAFVAQNFQGCFAVLFF